MAASTKYSYAYYRDSSLFVYTTCAQRDEACAERDDLKPIPASQAREHMRESLIAELWATPSEFEPGGNLADQDVLTRYYMQMVSQLG